MSDSNRMSESRESAAGHVDDESRTTIGKGSRVSIGLMIAAIGLMGSAHAYWSSRIASAEANAARSVAQLKEELIAARSVSLGALATQLADMESALQALRVEVRKQGDAVDRRLERIEERSSDRWTLTDQSLWVERLRQRNPTLDVPDPEPFRVPNRPR